VYIDALEKCATFLDHPVYSIISSLWQTFCSQLVFTFYYKCKKYQFVHKVNGDRWKTTKIIKKWYYPTSHCLNINVALSNIHLFMIIVVFDPLTLTLQINCYYQFQYFSFYIFRKFKRVNDDCRFKNGGLLSSWIFKFWFFFWPIGLRNLGSGEPRCLIIPNFVKMSQTVFEISRFFLFSKWMPSAIWDF